MNKSYKLIDKIIEKPLKKKEFALIVGLVGEYRPSNLGLYFKYQCVVEKYPIFIEMKKSSIEEKFRETKK